MLIKAVKIQNILDLVCGVCADSCVRAPTRTLKSLTCDEQQKARPASNKASTGPEIGEDTLVLRDPLLSVGRLCDWFVS
jgi:hypothetical protein